MEFQKILIGIDDSKYAENAARYGFELAHKFSAQVGLVHIVEPVVSTPLNDTSMLGTLVPSFSTSVEDVEMVNMQENFSKKLLDDIANKYGEGLTVSHFNEFGSKADAIIECAAQFGADLIVIGTHSRTGFDRFLMGSVAESIIRHSPVAVLVIPLPAEKVD
ncbi:nucleotide-binding universal stress UspA family protein [Mucilaginibacter gracilis]|uniref:Nucleotide-binding universal stress UspA family protein n=1 Tax=Mucilaginibacter gracilis TaxID=423350 RepID=A0A495IX71_9SPHI|nr:universal stress protein [Mucilaginibacter gracilis]RKR81317.1 nucleotide-binding universal stress UspA family protein [Mucilaginibacter gracilis]